MKGRCEDVYARRSSTSALRIQCHQHFYLRFYVNITHPTLAILAESTGIDDRQRSRERCQAKSPTSLPLPIGDAPAMP